jgi:hypothetical protein
MYWYFTLTLVHNTDFLLSGRICACDSNIKYRTEYKGTCNRVCDTSIKCRKNIKVRVIEHVMQALQVEKYKGTCIRTCNASIKCRQI